MTHFRTRLTHLCFRDARKPFTAKSAFLRAWAAARLHLLHDRAYDGTVIDIRAAYRSARRALPNADAATVYRIARAAWNASIHDDGDAAWNVVGRHDLAA